VSAQRSLPLFGVLALAVPALAMGATMSTSDYSVAKERAAVEYQAARAQCSQRSGNPRNLCLVEARATERKAMGDAEARYRDTDAARRDATIESAEVDFEVAKVKCAARVGNEREVCIKEAKALEVRTKAEAIATERIAAVHRDADAKARYRK